MALRESELSTSEESLELDFTLRSAEVDKRKE